MLRRVMRRAIQHGRLARLPAGLPASATASVVRELMGRAYPELHEQRERDRRLAGLRGGALRAHARAGARRTLARADRAGARERRALAGEDAFRLHDTFGFPIELTTELRRRGGLELDEDGFERLHGRPARRSRAGDAGGGDDAAGRERARSAFAGDAGFRDRFTATRRSSRRRPSAPSRAPNGRVLVKLADSPFYAAGGGQVSDVGVIECADGDCRARVAEVVRLGDDQALVRRRSSAGELQRGRARARAGRPPRAPRHRVQPHRDPPAAGRAARAPRRARAPGGLLRRARQAALRLQPRPGR